MRLKFCLINVMAKVVGVVDFTQVAISPKVFIL